MQLVLLRDMLRNDKLSQELDERGATYRVTSTTARCRFAILQFPVIFQVPWLLLLAVEAIEVMRCGRQRMRDGEVTAAGKALKRLGCVVNFKSSGHSRARQLLTVITGAV